MHDDVCPRPRRKNADLPIVSILLIGTLTFWISVITYYPGHIAYLSRRFSYYVFEDENVNAGLVFRQWTSREIGKAWSGVKAIGGGDGRPDL